MNYINISGVFDGDGGAADVRVEGAGPGEPRRDPTHTLQEPKQGTQLFSVYLINLTT